MREAPLPKRFDSVPDDTPFSVLFFINTSFAGTQQYRIADTSYSTRRLRSKKQEC